MNEIDTIKLPKTTTNKICRSCMPFSKVFDTSKEKLNQFKEISKADGCNGLLVIMMTDDEETNRLTADDISLKELYLSNGFKVLQVNIDGYPLLTNDNKNNEQFTKLFTQIKEAELLFKKDNYSIVSHCHSGYGRASTFLTLLYSKIFDVEPKDAMALMKDQIPKSFQKQNMIDFVNSISLHDLQQ